MSKYTKEQLEQQFATAPEMIRDALFSDETSNAVKKISDRHGLHVDQMGDLADEMGVVMLGLEPAKDFVKNIQDRLRLSASEAEQISMEVSKEVFVKLREAMQHPDDQAPSNAPETLEAAPGLLERKLSQAVNLKPNEQVIEINPDTPAAAPKQEPVITHADPYREPLQ